VDSESWRRHLNYLLTDKSLHIESGGILRGDKAVKWIKSMNLINFGFYLALALIMAINAFSLGNTWQSLQVEEAALQTYEIRNTLHNLLNSGRGLCHHQEPRWHYSSQVAAGRRNHFHHFSAGNFGEKFGYPPCAPPSCPRSRQNPGHGRRRQHP